MKKRFVLVIILICILICPYFAEADVVDDLDDNVDKGLDNIDFSEFDGIADNFGFGAAEKIKEIISGNFDGAESFLQVVAALAGDGVKDILPELSAVFAVLIIIGLVRHLSGGLISQSTGSVISFVGVAVILTSILSLITSTYVGIYQSINKVSALSDASMPILLTLLIANGGNVLSSVCQPSMVMFSSVVIKIISAVILPLTVFSIVFSIVGNLSSDVKVGKVSGFFNSAATWCLGVIFMLFSAFTSVQGISASAIDGVSYRAAKFAAKSYIPILGGYLADGFDIVLASTSLIKNAFGVAALIALLFAVIKPLITVIIVNLGLQAVSALAEPIVDGKYLKMLNGVGKTLSFLAVLIIAVAFMFCILILIAICCANVV